MKLNQKLSWKLMLPAGLVLWVVFLGAVRFIGSLLIIMGVIDLGREITKNLKNKKATTSPPENT